MALGQFIVTYVIATHIVCGQLCEYTVNFIFSRHTFNLEGEENVGSIIGNIITVYELSNSPGVYGRV